MVQYGTWGGGSGQTVTELRSCIRKRLAEIQANIYDDPELEKPQFQELLDQLWEAD